MTLQAPDQRPRRGWQRGLLLSGLALALAWTFHAADRRPQAPPQSAAAPAPSPRALPADASLATSSALALPRLLVILPSGTAAALPPDLLADLQHASVNHLAVRAGDAAVARALGLDVLPAFVLYDGAGRERRRLSGPQALAELQAELQALDIAVPALDRGKSP